MSVVMELPVTALAESGGSGTMTVSQKVFGSPYREDIVHRLVVAYRAKGRSGNKVNKNRSSVSGGGAKPWRQKGTGRARAGTTRGPLWRKGGVTFAASQRDYSQKINKKLYRCGMRSIFSEMVRQNRLIVVDDFIVKAPKTREALSNFSTLSLSSALVLTDKLSDNLQLAIRNLPHFYVCDAAHVDPVSLVSSDMLVLTAAAVKKIEAWLE